MATTHSAINVQKAWGPPSERFTKSRKNQTGQGMNDEEELVLLGLLRLPTFIRSNTSQESSKSNISDEASRSSAGQNIDRNSKYWWRPGWSPTDRRIREEAAL